LLKNKIHSISLSTSSGGVNKNTLKRYIEYLEAAFLLRTVKRTDNNVKHFRRSTKFKMYLTNPSLRSALFSPLHAADDHICAMVETAFFSQWMHRDWIEPWYAQWSKGEVDLSCLDEKKFKPLWAVEIKWSNRYFEHPAELKSLLSFCATNQLQKAVVTTIEGGQRGEWSAAYLCSCIGLRVCGWPKHTDSEETATVNYLKFLIMLFTASCRAPRLSLQI